MSGRTKSWLAALAVAFVMAACSSSTPTKTFQSPPTGPPANGGPSVQQQNFSFTPSSIDVKAGASVTVSLRASIQGARNPGRPWRTSIVASGSVYGPDVS